MDNFPNPQGCTPSSAHVDRRSVDVEQEEPTVSSYRITLKDRTTEQIDDADAYQQEGQMTTFFRLGDGRRVVDTWSTRLASFRTSEVLAIRRVDASAALHGSEDADLAGRVVGLGGLRSA